jgi:hypothetical protein
LAFFADIFVLLCFSHSLLICVLHPTINVSVVGMRLANRYLVMGDFAVGTWLVLHVCAHFAIQVLLDEMWKIYPA